ncbi:origin recognition complex subunit 1 [Maudiozyma humilis]|uniref:Origin recognition complex subunit 1 n=1 Tax=Maudiozyma humilis TaxID=51915 RepID=A0AAV5RQQ6_MAUHU|nr:origin recognition complex subunit 1 [Kazachstania humilis]
MATKASELDGWEIKTIDEAGNEVNENKRRSRRGNNTLRTIIQKKSGDKTLQIGCGTSILAQEEDEEKPSFYLVYDIRTQTLSSLLELWTLCYIRTTDIPPLAYFKEYKPEILETEKSEDELAELMRTEADPDELVLIVRNHEVKVSEIKEIVRVTSKKDRPSDFSSGKDFVVEKLFADDKLIFAPFDLSQELGYMRGKSSSEITSHLRYLFSKDNNEDIKPRKSQSRRKKDEKTTSGEGVNEYVTDEMSDSSFDSDPSDGEDADDSDVKVEELIESGDDDNEDNHDESIDEDDVHSEDEEPIDDDDSGDYGVAKRPRGRPRKTGTQQKKPARSAVKRSSRKSNSTAKASPLKKPKKNPTTVRRFMKRNVVRAKKKYTPFSKRYRSIKDIPDLTNFGNFNNETTDEYLEGLEGRLTTKTKHKVVETIFSKVKKQLYSSHGKDEIVKASNFGEFLPARENEFASIYLSVYSALESSSSTTVYIAGTPGVGKTLTVREVIKELQHSSSEGELPPFQYVEINGLKMVKPTDSYEVLWNKISGESLTWGAAMESLQFYFEKVPMNKKRPVIVLLDELDALITKHEDLMYNFFNWTSYQNAKLILIAVANTMDLPERQLGNKVSSRIGFTRIMFTGYTHEELKSIIDLRLQGINDSFFYVDKNTGNACLVDEYIKEHGLEKMTSNLKKVRLRMSPDAIEIASRKIASVSGDARRALKACKRAAEIAEQNYMTQHGYSYDGHAAVDTYDDFVQEEGDLPDETPTSYEKEVDEDGVEYEIQVVRINHIMKALNETLNTNVTRFISGCSFTTKLILFAYMSLIKKSGFEEQTIADIIDEVRLLIEVNGNNKFVMGISKVLFPRETASNAEPLRMASWDLVFGRLVDAGIIVRQSMRNERLVTIKFNVPIDEVKRAVDMDDNLKDF